VTNKRRIKWKKGGEKEEERAIIHEKKFEGCRIRG